VRNGPREISGVRVRVGARAILDIVGQSFPPLHTATAPAVRAAGKTQLSYRNDTIIPFFLAANKTKDNAQVALASSIS